MKEFFHEYQTAFNIGLWAGALELALLFWFIVVGA
jgi:hypothetical protein